jgi:hypothetical protein
LSSTSSTSRAQVGEQCVQRRIGWRPTQTERDGDEFRHQGSIGQGTQLDEPRTTGKPGGHLARNAQRKAGFAAAACPRQRQQARLTQRPPNLFYGTRAANQGR